MAGFNIDVLPRRNIGIVIGRSVLARWSRFDDPKMYAGGRLVSYSDDVGLGDSRCGKAEYNDGKEWANIVGTATSSK